MQPASGRFLGALPDCRSIRAYLALYRKQNLRRFRRPIGRCPFTLNSRWEGQTSSPARRLVACCKITDVEHRPLYRARTAASCTGIPHLAAGRPLWPSARRAAFARAECKSREVRELSESRVRKSLSARPWLSLVGDTPRPCPRVPRFLIGSALRRQSGGADSGPRWAGLIPDRRRQLSATYALGRSRKAGR